MDKEIVT